VCGVCVVCVVCVVCMVCVVCGVWHWGLNPGLRCEQAGT
jgi:hypothetical protein